MIVKFTGTGLIKNVGIGTIPTNKFEIKSDTIDRSGLKFTRLNSLSATKPANGKGLSVDGNGNVILVPIAAYTPTTPDSMLVKFTGTGLNKNVGIGTVSPNNKLEINGTGSGLRFTNLKSTNAVSTWGGKVLSVDANGDVVLVKDSVGTTSVATSVWTSIANNRIQNANTGAVVIGALNTTALPGNYKLYVKDGILTEEVKIAAEGSLDWADYVFAKNYKLRKLSEVANFVKINKHLPGVPSAEEVSKNGINVAKMEAKLLEKIEELTLYMIDMKNENKQLKNRLKRLEKKK
jgi:trimeric autotransporter adhesin